MENLINQILGKDFEIIRKVEYNEFIFIFFKPKGYSNPYKDERLNLISNQGPLKINKKTKEYEFTHIYEFYSEYADNKIIFPNKKEVDLNWEEVVYNIKMRKHFNWEDFDLLLKHNNIPLDNFDIYSLNSRDTVEIEIKSDEAIDCLLKFLSEVEARYIKKSHNHFLIDLDLL